MLELIEKRQENSKRFRLDSRREQLVISIGAIHYKDDYADKSEGWKDIDLTWGGNRITKAPYELTREGYKLTIRNKKSGGVSTIELLGGANPDVDIEIVPEFSRVRFVRILKSANAPLTARFRVTGNFTVSASDEDGEIPVESTLKGGILTETLKPDRPIKYPVRIDPTWQVGTGNNDTYRRLTADYYDRSSTSQVAGAYDASLYQYGGGMRFTNITIPNGATIENGTHLILNAKSSTSAAGCLTRISAEDVDDAVEFSTSSATFDSRWANRTTARVNWDNIGSWTTGQDYNSPEIKTVLKEIVDRGGWASGQDIVIFWEDFERRSTEAVGNIRWGGSYEYSAENAPQLVITFLAATPAAPGGSPLAALIDAGII